MASCRLAYRGLLRLRNALCTCRTCSTGRGWFVPSWARRPTKDKGQPRGSPHDDSSGGEKWNACLNEEVRIITGVGSCFRLLPQTSTVFSPRVLAHRDGRTFINVLRGNGGVSSRTAVLQSRKASGKTLFLSGTALSQVFDTWPISAA